MRVVDINKTIDRCEEAFSASMLDSSMRYTVFTPVFFGEEYEEGGHSVNTTSTSWAEDEIISYYREGVGTVDAMPWDECYTESLYKSLEGRPLAEVESASEIIQIIDNDYNPDQIEYTEEDAKIVRKWMSEEIEADIDHWWREAGGVTKRNEAEDAIREFCKRNNLRVRG